MPKKKGEPIIIAAPEELAAPVVVNVPSSAPAAAPIAASVPDSVPIAAQEQEYDDEPAALAASAAPVSREDRKKQYDERRSIRALQAKIQRYRQTFPAALKNIDEEDIARALTPTASPEDCTFVLDEIHLGMAASQTRSVTGIFFPMAINVLETTVAPMIGYDLTGLGAVLAKDRSVGEKLVELDIELFGPGQYVHPAISLGMTVATAALFVANANAARANAAQAPSTSAAPQTQ